MNSFCTWISAIPILTVCAMGSAQGTSELDLHTDLVRKLTVLIDKTDLTKVDDVSAVLKTPFERFESPYWTEFASMQDSPEFPLDGVRLNHRRNNLGEVSKVNLRVSIKFKAVCLTPGEILKIAGPLKNQQMVEPDEMGSIVLFREKNAESPYRLVVTITSGCLSSLSMNGEK